MSIECFTPFIPLDKSDHGAKGLILSAETFYIFPGDKRCSHGRSVFFGGFEKTPEERSRIRKILSSQLGPSPSKSKQGVSKDTYECIADMLVEVETGSHMWKDRFFVIDSRDSTVPRPSFMQSTGGDPRFYAALKDIALCKIWDIKIDDLVYVEDEVSKRPRVPFLCQLHPDVR